MVLVKGIKRAMELYVFLSTAIFAAVLALVVFFFLKDGDRRRKAEYRRHAMGDILPNRLQAYERLSLYLSRITPDEMAVREQVGAASAKDLFLAMVNSVRQEFEHNAAMQIYVTSASWSRVVRAKDEVMKTMNEALKTVSPTASALEYSAEFVELGRNTCCFYLDRAIDGLRKDVAGEFIEA